MRGHAPTRGRTNTATFSWLHHFILVSVVAAAPVVPGVEVNNDTLILHTQVAALVNGRLPIPDNTERIVLEIGSSDRNTMDVEFMPTASSTTFLVTLEPLIDKCRRALGTTTSLPCFAQF